jgi:hypothetical protein
LRHLVGKVSQHDLTRLSAEADAIHWGTYRGANISANANAADLNAGILIFPTAAEKSFLVSKVVDQLVIARASSRDHGTAGDADLLGLGNRAIVDGSKVRTMSRSEANHLNEDTLW